MNTNKLTPIEVQVNNGKVVLKAPDLVPAGIRGEVEALLTNLNLKLEQQILKLEEVDLAPMALAGKEPVLRAKPCNWEGCETEWWGVRAYLSSDTVFYAGMGTVVATGIATRVGGPIALIVGAIVMLHIILISAFADDCGVEVEITWAGVLKSIKGRNSPQQPTKPHEKEPGVMCWCGKTHRPAEQHEKEPGVMCWCGKTHRPISKPR